MTDPGLLRAAMVAGLTERGALDESWGPAMLAVPRHAFLPDTIWEQDRSVSSADDLIAVHREADADGWLRRAYADRHVITQVDDGKPTGPVQSGREATSSVSMPTVVARMLTALDLAPGMRVLEIGTGTGYNAALLCHRVGAGNVTTVELDPRLADAAREALHRVGLGPDVRAGDGAAGAADRAPFDRIIATAAMDHIPAAWIEQLAQGGIIVADVRARHRVLHDHRRGRPGAAVRDPRRRRDRALATAAVIERGQARGENWALPAAGTGHAVVRRRPCSQAPDRRCYSPPRPLLVRRCPSRSHSSSRGSAGHAAMSWSRGMERAA